MFLLFLSLFNFSPFFSSTILPFFSSLTLHLYLLLFTRYFSSLISCFFSSVIPSRSTLLCNFVFSPSFPLHFSFCSTILSSNLPFFPLSADILNFFNPFHSPADVPLQFVLPVPSSSPFSRILLLSAPFIGCFSLTTIPFPLSRSLSLSHTLPSISSSS